MRRNEYWPKLTTRLNFLVIGHLKIFPPTMWKPAVSIFLSFRVKKKSVSCHDLLLFLLFFCFWETPFSGVLAKYLKTVVLQLNIEVTTAREIRMVECLAHKHSCQLHEIESKKITHIKITPTIPNYMSPKQEKGLKPKNIAK